MDLNSQSVASTLSFSLSFLPNHLDINPPDFSAEGVVAGVVVATGVVAAVDGVVAESPLDLRGLGTVTFGAETDVVRADAEAVVVGAFIAICRPGMGRAGGAGRVEMDLYYQKN